MIPCSAAEICRAVGGTLLQDADAAVTNVSTDSRTAAAGDLFIPLVGEKFDGHAYLDGALARGAAGCLTMHTPTALQPGKFYILVDDTLLALRALHAPCRADHRFRRQDDDEGDGRRGAGPALRDA